MTQLHIETGDNNAILRKISTPIATHEFHRYRSLADDMIKYIKNPKNGGVGLAAPQVGINKRLIAVSLMDTYDDENYRTIAMVNPVILAHSENTTSDNEGCLSVPGESGEVIRWQWIKIEFFDIRGTRYRMKLDHLAARIVQHEIDHLDGILFTDKVENIILAM